MRYTRIAVADPGNLVRGWLSGVSYNMHYGMVRERVWEEDVPPPVCSVQAKEYFVPYNVA